MENIKKLIAQNFSKAAIQYEQEAILQKMCAERLAQIIKNYQAIIVPGAGAEIGCGTGFLTKQLLTLFPSKPMDITDLSVQMVEQCKSNYCHSNLSFSVQDGENYPQKAYAFIASNLAFQWFSRFKESFSKLQDSLKREGILFFSTLVEGSFAEWKNICQAYHFPYTANPLPKVEDLESIYPEGVFEIQTYSLFYPSALHFFRHLQNIGASTSVGKQLAPLTLKQLIKAWNHESPSEITVSYRVVFGVIKV
ncbi:methyltransferase domain-containing protein [Parachlamydia acanthamoebae]|jgi:malonyl-CoA O-methyltransferase|uniref:methyltransferase domain-containing protein n=1 Tax=Parachlamydia acanthamoebae TaxID=83552 RepID=UPI0024E209AA|nr:methyltransferase domain-containing protein [Parachlamydia acanthamoebae]